MRSRAIGALLLVLAGSPALLAQQAPPVPTISFDAAIQRAMERNPTVARAATSIMRAEAILGQARALTRPNVIARITSSTLDQGVAFDDNVVQPQSQVTFTATASMPVLAPARWAATAQARDQIDVATKSTDEVRTQIAVATAQAYLAVITVRQQLAVEQSARETAGAHLDYAQRRFEAGASSRLNMLRAAQEATDDDVRIEQARLTLRQAQEALGVLLVADGPMDAEGEPALEIPPNATLESAWMAARPDVLRQVSLIQAADRVVRDSWKDIAPAVTAAFDPQYVTPAGVFQHAHTWRFSVLMTQPIFQGGLQRAVTAERAILFNAQQLALAEVQNQARSEVRLAQESVVSRERMLASARQAVAQAEEVLTITTTAFEAGATTNLEVIDAQRSARDAETRAALSEGAFRRARLDLLVAVGRFPR